MDSSFFHFLVSFFFFLLFLLSATAVEFGGSLFERSERTVTGGARDKGGRGGGVERMGCSVVLQTGCNLLHLRLLYATGDWPEFLRSGVGGEEVRKGKLERGY